MIPELGHLALILALGLALVQGVLPLWGAARRNAGADRRRACRRRWRQSLLVAFAFGA